MTARRTWTLVCDLCGATFDLPDPAPLHRLRAASAEAGWRGGTTRRHPDHCASCAYTREASSDAS